MENDYAFDSFEVIIDGEKLLDEPKQGCVIIAKRHTKKRSHPRWFVDLEKFRLKNKKTGSAPALECLHNIAENDDSAVEKCAP